MTTLASSSIYSSLFKYRPRPRRLPGEDFLTVALSDLLNGLPQQAQSAFVSDVLLVATSVKAWRAFVGDGCDRQLR